MTIPVKIEYPAQLSASVSAPAGISVKINYGGSVLPYNIGEGLKLDYQTNTISVDVAHDAQQDNTRPISSAAVYTELGNIDILLKTI